MNYKPENRIPWLFTDFDNIKDFPWLFPDLKKFSFFPHFSLTVAALVLVMDITITVYNNFNYYKSWFAVEPSVSEEILLANNNIAVLCKTKLIYPQTLHFYQKLQAKRMNFRPTSFQKPLFLACNHVTRWPCWWCVGGQYNRIFRV